MNKMMKTNVKGLATGPKSNGLPVSPISGNLNLITKCLLFFKSFSYSMHFPSEHKLHSNL